MKRVIVVVTDLGFMLLAIAFFIIGLYLYFNANIELREAARLYNECERPQFFAIVPDNKSEVFYGAYDQKRGS